MGNRLGNYEIVLVRGVVGLEKNSRGEEEKKIEKNVIA